MTGSRSLFRWLMNQMPKWLSFSDQAPCTVVQRKGVAIEFSVARVMLSDSCSAYSPSSLRKSYSRLEVVNLKFLATSSSMNDWKLRRLEDVRVLIGWETVLCRRIRRGQKKRSRVAEAHISVRGKYDEWGLFQMHLLSVSPAVCCARSLHFSRHSWDLLWAVGFVFWEFSGKYQLPDLK